MESTVEARERLDSMISLVTTLFEESLNASSPSSGPGRTISKEQFVTDYSEHSQALCALLDRIEADPLDPPDIDVASLPIQSARADLEKLAKGLNAKIRKLNTLCFWMDNVVLRAKPKN